MASRPSSVNLLDYGAIGNGMGGATKDTQAFIKAFNDISGGPNAGCVLYVPPGLYMVTQPIPIFISLIIQGVYDQSIIQAIPGLNDWMFYFAPYGMGPVFPLAGSRNAMGRANVASKKQYNAMGRVGFYDTPIGLACVFRDITLNHDAANQTNGGCIWAVGAVRSIFEHVHFQNSYDAGLRLGPIVPGANGFGNHVNRCVFDGGSVSTGSGQGLRLIGSDKNNIAFNSFDDNGGTGTENYHVKDSGNYNIFEGNAFSTGHEGIRLNSTLGSRVLGNTFDTLGRACVHSTGSLGNISDNVMLGGGTDAANTYSQIELEGTKNVVMGNYQSSGAVNGQLRSFYREWSSAADKNTGEANSYDVSGATLGTALVENLGPLTKFANNPGYNPVGSAVIPPASPPLSGVTYTNNTGVNCLIGIHATTAIASVVVGGASIAIGGTGTFVYLPVGQTIRFTGTGTLTWAWFGD